MGYGHGQRRPPETNWWTAQRPVLTGHPTAPRFARTGPAIHLGITLHGREQRPRTVTGAGSTAGAQVSAYLLADAADLAGMAVSRVRSVERSRLGWFSIRLPAADVAWLFNDVPAPIGGYTCGLPG